MKNHCRVVDGNLEVVDTFYYGGDKALANLVNEWTSPTGTYAKYFKDEYGVTFELVSSDRQIVATGRYKKLLGSVGKGGVVIIQLKVI